MNRTEILRSLPEPREPETVSFGQVVAVSNIFFVGGIDILCIDLFYRGELGVRYLSDRKTRNVWDARTNRWSTVKLENAALKMQENRTNNPYSYYYAGHETYVWDTGKDEERTEEYLRQNIYYWEESMDARKRVQAEQRKQNRLNEKMDVVPAIPEGVEKWILDMLIPENYLFVHRDENACSCTSCGGLSVPDPKWKNRQQGSCPVCGNKAMVWIGKAKANEKKNIIVLQSYKDYYEDKKLNVKVEKEMWAERQFTAEVFWPWGDKKYVNCYEQLRALIPKGKTYGDLFFGIHDNAEEFEQEFSEKNVRNQQFRESYLYPGNLQEMLPYGHLEHSGMRELAEAGQRFN
ncbi:MAG: hypothetical protein Q4B26_04765, partial [Eubacteriales bacterium]|nr:hypothetical protein [Eubacteriales bacterium]